MRLKKKKFTTVSSRDSAYVIVLFWHLWSNTPSSNPYFPFFFSSDNYFLKII